MREPVREVDHGPELPSLIARALEDAGADGRGLCIELTETAAIVHVDRAKRFASAVAALGCELSLDDFGAGFASFYYLKHLTFDVLKIDGEFVRDLPTSHMNQLLVKSVVDIARGLGKRTVAEFVGDEGTLEMLRSMGVDFAQGYYVAKPQPLDAVGARAPTSTRAQAVRTRRARRPGSQAGWRSAWRSRCRARRRRRARGRGASW